MRIGHGYDVHKLVDGRKCIIGLVELLCGEFLDTVLPFDCDRPVNRDVRVVALMVLLYAGFTQVREW